MCVQRVDDLWFFDKRDDSEFGESVYMSACVYMYWCCISEWVGVYYIVLSAYLGVCHCLLLVLYLRVGVHVSAYLGVCHCLLLVLYLRVGVHVSVSLGEPLSLIGALSQGGCACVSISG